MSERPTPETDAAWSCFKGYMEPLQDVKDLSSKLERERDEAREQLSAAKREAEYLATSIHRAEYSNVAPNWGLCDSVAGVISQIDNMYAGVREMRDEARDAIRALAEHGESEIQRITKERDEAREEVDCFREKHDLTPMCWNV
jgi:sugar-specific transcriptional regulator TrmB